MNQKISLFTLFCICFFFSHLILAANTPAKKESNRAMWVEQTESLLSNLNAQEELIHFCQQQKITQIFLKVPYQISKDKFVWQMRWNKPKLQELLSRLHQSNIAVYALDEAAQFALLTEQGRMAFWLDQIIQFNREGLLQERFDGIHWDIEPQTFPGISGVKAKEIPERYLFLLEEDALKTRHAGLKFSVAIPSESSSLKLVTEAEQKKKKAKPLLELFLGCVDQVVVMPDYAQIQTPLEIAAQIKMELAYAAKQGRTIFMGMGTEQLPNELGLNEELNGAPSFAGIAIHSYETYRLWLQQAH